MPKRREKIEELKDKLASLDKLRPDLGEEIVNRKIEEIQTQIQKLQAGRDIVGRDQIVQASEGGTAIQGDVNNSAIIHAQTVVLADRLWRDLQPGLPAPDLSAATSAYLNFLVDRHYYLSLKGMGVSDRIPVRLSLLNVYVPLRARLELPEGETWKRETQLAGREMTDD